MNSNTIEILINQTPYLVNKNITIIQACLKNNLDIPRFCFHENLKIAGNCRMCLVEVVKSIKPIASCAMQVTPGMSIKTNSALVKKAREGVLEFVLANHPLDCPICDQGGECDLQDQALIFGGDKGRFYEFKRSVEDKNLGPFVKTVMTRCIHCTRCVRFLTDVVGDSTLGVLGRGSSMEIGTYLNKILTSELVGNIIDLCPVGALTSKSYAFTARSWELLSVETIDILDSYGSDIRVDLRGSVLLRILPRLNLLTNNNWLSDVSRFSLDGVNIQRILLPYIRTEKNNLVNTDWKKNFIFLNDYFFINNIILKKKVNYSFFIGDLLDSKNLLILKEFGNSLGTSFFSNSINSKLDIDYKESYLLFKNKNSLNNSIVSSFIFIGVNLRLESPLYNIKLRKLFLKYNILIINFGAALNISYYIKHIGLGLNNFLKFLEGNHFLCNLLLKYSNIVFIYGNSVLRRNDFSVIHKIMLLYIKLFNFFDINYSIGMLQTKMGLITSSELGLTRGINYYNDLQCFHKSFNVIKNALSINYNVGVYKKLFNKISIVNQFNVFLGHHSYSSINSNDVILPTLLYLEMETSYLNIENNVCFSNIVLKNNTISKNLLRILTVMYFNNRLRYKIRDQFYSLYLLIFINFKQLLNISVKSQLNIVIYSFNLLFYSYFHKSINYLFMLINFNYGMFWDQLYNYYLRKYYYNSLLLSLDVFSLDINCLDIYILKRLYYFAEIFNIKSNNLHYQFFSFNSLEKFVNLVVLINNYPFVSYMANFYKQNIISLHSNNMSKASILFKLNFSNYL